MIKNVLDYLEYNAIKLPNHIAFKEQNNEVTYSETVKLARNMGINIYNKIGGINNRPIIVYIEKSISCLISMLAVLYSGNCYVCVDPSMPKERLNAIVDNLKPIAIIYNEESENLKEIQETSEMQKFSVEILMNDCVENCAEIANNIRSKIIDTDPAYILYTSGSTGIPKGSVISHKSIIAYAEWLTNTFDFNSDTVFGSQTPFYFSMSVLDVYSTIRNGATLVIIPKKYFSFPIKLLDFINQNNINTIYWVPSALAIVARCGAFNYISIPQVNKILFAGEVMQTKILNKWKEYLPKALYANLFGPTEITDIALYYIVDRDFSNDEPLPIGKCCTNMDAFALNQAGEKVKDNEIGELYFRGSFVGFGYYNSPEKTKEMFVQNPLNKAYPEIVYKTGDLVKKNEYGEYMYMGRADTQIKHSGYRIELGEIEHAANALEEVDSSVALYDVSCDNIMLVYQGSIESNELLENLQKLYLPSYMLPEKIIKINRMPYNANGKIDRVLLKKEYVEGV